jgi:putative salt-induced outer membrane protein
MNMRVILLLAGLALASRAGAQETQATATVPGPPDDPWSGKAALGYLATSGNTEGSSLNSAFAIAYSTGRWTHALDLAAINTTEEEQTTAEAYAAGWKSEFNMTDKDFLFGRVNWRKDRFSGYDQQLSESIGYGRRLIDTGVHFLNAEIGAGARQSVLSDGTTEDDFIVRGGLNYRWAFSATAEFTQVVATESGSQNTYLESVSAIKASVIGDLALVASFTVKNNSEVPVDNEQTDTFTALSLEYSF